MATKAGAGGGDGGREQPIIALDFAQSLETRRALPAELLDYDDNQQFISLEADLPAAAKMAIQCQSIFLVQIANWPELKTVWEKKCWKVGWWTFCINVPRVYRRICTHSYYLQICHPGLQDIITVVKECLKQALTPALMALLLQKQLSAFLSVLKSELISCLKAKGVKLLEQFSLGLKEEVSCSAWQPI
jgi:hypothetical protein